MPEPKYKLKVVLTLSGPTGARLEKMAKDREMELHALVNELVYLGMLSLDYRPLKLESSLKGIDPSDDTLR